MMKYVVFLHYQAPIEVVDVVCLDAPVTTLESTSPWNFHTVYSWIVYSCRCYTDKWYPLDQESDDVFRSDKKISHMLQKTHIVANSQKIIHPLPPIHDRDLNNVKE